MAINTQEKRASVTGVGRPWMRGKEPETLKNEAWRFSSGLIYAGNSFVGALYDYFFSRRSSAKWYRASENV